MGRRSSIALLLLSAALLVPACGKGGDGKAAGVNLLTAALQGNLQLQEGARPRVVRDASGGTIVAWIADDLTINSAVKVQRYDSNASELWAGGGITISGAGSIRGFEAAEDGAEGILLCWTQMPAGTANATVYAQRISHSGSSLWTPGGVVLQQRFAEQIDCQIVSDGAGGAVVSWNDNRNMIGSSSDTEHFCQHLSAAGTATWTAGGVSIATTDSPHFSSALTTDQAGGAIFAWVNASEVRLQRITSTGSSAWGVTGQAVGASGGGQWLNSLVPDSSGGAIAAWQDSAGGSSVYAQRLSSAGTLLWGASGVQVSGLQCSGGRLAEDGAGGAFIVWAVTSGSGDNYVDLQAQHLNGAGAAQWVSGGVTVSNAVDNQAIEQIFPDASGGLTLLWSDFRSLTDYDLYLGRISSNGVVQNTLSGLPLANALYDQRALQGCLLSADRLFIAWTDLRGGLGTSAIYGQIVEASGIMNPPVPAGRPVAPWHLSNHPVTTWPRVDRNATTVPDGSGGAIVAWSSPVGASNDLYAQRINSNGDPLWGAKGTLICIGTADQFPSIAPDGGGGAMIAWTDYRNATTVDIYGQRINSTGSVQWAANGIPLVANPSRDEGSVRLVSDGLQGAILFWFDNRGPNGALLARRISSVGALSWTPDGVELTSLPGYACFAISDGSGGAVVAWDDRRNAGTNTVFAQRVDSSGASLWTTGGVGVFNSPGQITSALISDRLDGWIVGGSNGAPIAQRLNSTGVPLWAAAGVPLRSPTSTAGLRSLVPDGSGGAIGFWEDSSGSLPALHGFLQRLDASGTRLWTTDGVSLSPTTVQQNFSDLQPDGAGGAIVLWWELETTDYRIKAQRFSGLGVPLWAPDGQRMTSAAGSQQFGSAISDGSGGALFLWSDGRRSTTFYAQHLQGNGAP